MKKIILLCAVVIITACTGSRDNLSEAKNAYFLHDYSRALDFFSAALRRDSGSPDLAAECHNYMAKIHFLQRNKTDFYRQFDLFRAGYSTRLENRAVKKTLSMYYFFSSVFLEKLENQKSAYEDLVKAVTMQPDNPFALHRLGYFFLIKNNTAKYLEVSKLIVNPGHLTLDEQEMLNQLALLNQLYHALHDGRDSAAEELILVSKNQPARFRFFPADYELLEAYCAAWKGKASGAIDIFRKYYTNSGIIRSALQFELTANPFILNIQSSDDYQIFFDTFFKQE
ncbi:MAG: hypothetical protein A2096_02720 [Spirochaetes bacterium GWF1_41_5]|nr:MAG: hypothetical protein A2096_02720 [Spirochaetes bacterium GWF1_41_5]HBE01113.1 hypothetical protein [Spirochaetia bacterium]